MDQIARDRLTRLLRHNGSVFKSLVLRLRTRPGADDDLLSLARKHCGARETVLCLAWAAALFAVRRGHLLDDQQGLERYLQRVAVEGMRLEEVQCELFRELLLTKGEWCPAEWQIMEWYLTRTLLSALQIIHRRQWPQLSHAAHRAGQRFEEYARHTEGDDVGLAAGGIDIGSLGMDRFWKLGRFSCFSVHWRMPFHGHPAEWRQAAGALQVAAPAAKAGPLLLQDHPAVHSGDDGAPDVLIGGVEQAWAHAPAEMLHEDMGRSFLRLPDPYEQTFAEILLDDFCLVETVWLTRS